MLVIFIPPPTFNYTHISLLAEAGMPIRAIMERVGHANMKTTLEIYNQVSTTSKEKLKAKIHLMRCFYKL